MVCDNKLDILTQSQMFKAPDADKFVTTQAMEIKGLMASGVMKAHPCTSLPKGARLLSSLWSYRRKRLPDGTLLNHKACLCVNGKEQPLGHDYWETYAPMASWSTICLLLLLSTMMNLKTRQVDYNQAFPQAKLHDPVFIKAPQGWFSHTAWRPPLQWYKSLLAA